MYLRKIKKKCGVRGCNCTESYAVSKTREAGNSVIICKNCLKEAAKGIESGKLKIESGKLKTES